MKTNPLPYHKINRTDSTVGIMVVMHEHRTGKRNQYLYDETAINQKLSLEGS